jgi:hypothetical protein
MSYLQTDIEASGGIFVFTVDVFQIVAPVFLDIEPLVFDFPSLPPSIVCERSHGRCCGGNVGQIQELFPLMIVFIEVDAMNQIQGMLMIGDIIGPSDFLPHRSSFPGCFVFRLQR